MVLETRRIKKWGQVFPIPATNVGALVEENLNHTEIAVFNGFHERERGDWVDVERYLNDGINICSSFYEQPNRSTMTVGNGLVDAILELGSFEVGHSPEWPCWQPPLVQFALQIERSYFRRIEH
ncbi:hypothetical protein N7512_003078 [Penicillium capsulatum]|nr:hypothetical protein N7512_003078 [Penicillium capsulatum]